MRPVFHFDNITDGGFLNDGSLVTVNGVATYFGTTLINDKTVNNAVVQYNYGENTWKEIKSTETSRVSQTVVVIPESWLCKHTGQPSHVIFINIFILIFYETNLLIHVFNADRIL